MFISFYKPLNIKGLNSKKRGFKALVECEPHIYIQGEIENRDTGDIAFIDRPLKILHLGAKTIELQIDGVNRRYIPESLTKGCFIFCEMENEFQE